MGNWKEYVIAVCPKPTSVFTPWAMIISGFLIDGFNFLAACSQALKIAPQEPAALNSQALTLSIMIPISDRTALLSEVS